MTERSYSEQLQASASLTNIRDAQHETSSQDVSYRDKYRSQFEVKYPQRLVGTRILMDEMGGLPGLLADLRSTVKVSVHLFWFWPHS